MHLHCPRCRRIRAMVFQFRYWHAGRMWKRYHCPVCGEARSVRANVQPSRAGQRRG